MVLALLLIGAVLPGEAQAQQDPAVSFPLSVTSETADTTAVLTLGLDPEATAGIDETLGEEEYPPPPPSDIFDTRLVGEELGEGVLIDIRPGDTDFGGEREHEVQYQPGPEEDEITFSWDLPNGVTGTFEDVASGGDLVSVEMEGSDSYTLTNLNLTNFSVTINYNTAPQVGMTLPDDELEVDGPSLWFLNPTAVFEDEDGDDLSVTADSDAPSVLSVTEENEGFSLEPNAEGTAEVTLTASDGAEEASTSFSVEVTPDDGEEDPSGLAMAAVSAAANGETIDFGDADIKVAFADVTGTGSVGVARYESGPDGTDGIDETNVSHYRAVVASKGSLDFGSGTEVRFPVADFDGIDSPESVVMYSRSTPGTGTFASLPTSVDDGGTPDDIFDDEIVGETTSFSEFVLASNDNPLPVELTDFAATRDGSAALLSWRTASESGNAGFEVQHQAPDANRYANIGFVESTAEDGTTDSPQAYQFRAEALAAGTHQFRLRQVDVDGTATLSDSVQVEVKAEQALSLTLTGPNPVRQSTQLAFTVKQDGPVDLALYNVLGQRVKQMTARKARVGEQYTVDLSATGLSSGTYFVRLSAPSGTQTRRIVVVQ